MTKSLGRTRTLCWIFPGEKCIIGPAISLDAASAWHHPGAYVVRAVLSRVTPACILVFQEDARASPSSAPIPRRSFLLFPLRHPHDAPTPGSRVVALTLYRIPGRDARGVSSHVRKVSTRLLFPQTATSLSERGHEYKKKSQERDLFIRGYR